MMRKTLLAMVLGLFLVNFANAEEKILWQQIGMGSKTTEMLFLPDKDLILAVVYRDPSRLKIEWVLEDGKTWTLLLERKGPLMVKGPVKAVRGTGSFRVTARDRRKWHIAVIEVREKRR